MNANIPTEVNTTPILINVLSGDVSPPSEEISDNKITYPIEAAIHTNFLPLLKDTSYELCKLDYMIEVICGKQLIQMSDETDGILLLNRKNVIVLHIYQAGLVSNVLKKYQKDSPDFILVRTIDRELFSTVILMKACCSSLIAAKERRRLNSER